MDQSLNEPSHMPSLGAESTFVSCLSDQGFTYAIFEELARTFNGDMFVVDELKALHRSVPPPAGSKYVDWSRHRWATPLFLWAYDFSVSPRPY